MNQSFKFLKDSIKFLQDFKHHTIAVENMLHERFKERMKDKYWYSSITTESDFESDEEFRERNREKSQEKRLFHVITVILLAKPSQN